MPQSHDLPKKAPFRFFNNGPSLVLLALLVFLPVYGPYMVAIEGRALPVTTSLEFVEAVAAKDGGLDVRFRYNKLRDCEYLNSQASKGEVQVDFEPVMRGRASQIRPLGSNVSRLWHLGADDFTDLQIWFVHRCHPLWITVTKVFG